MFLISITPAWAGDYKSLISQARQQMENEHFAEALATAKEAVSEKPNDYQGHYYAAMAHMSLGQLDEADAEVATSLSQAPKSAKPAVEKLAGIIKSGRKGTELAKEQTSDIAKNIILECRGSHVYEKIRTGEPSVPAKISKFTEIWNISEHSIQEWLNDSNSWGENLCVRKSAKCNLTDASFTFLLKKVTSKDGDVFTSSSSILINRRSGKFSRKWDFESKFESGNESSHSDDYNGECIPRSDPSKEGGPNKF
jgi:tetratricopeptide (TPR) repeat protein